MLQLFLKWFQNSGSNFVLSLEYLPGIPMKYQDCFSVKLFFKTCLAHSMVYLFPHFLQNNLFCKLLQVYQLHYIISSFCNSHPVI